jgi:hypothetical protein
LEPYQPIPRKPRWDQPLSPERKMLKRDYPSDRPHTYHDRADLPRPRYEMPSHDRHYSSERDSRGEYSDRDSRRDYPDRDYESRRQSSRPHIPSAQHDSGGPRVPRDQQFITEELPESIREMYPNMPQNKKKAKLSSPVTNQKPKKRKKNPSKKMAPNEANYYGPGGQADKPQVHPPRFVPAPASANESKNKKSFSLKAEDNMNNFQVHGNLAQKSTAPPADNDGPSADENVIDLSLDDDGDSASMNPEMTPQATMSTTAAPLPPTPKEAPLVNKDKGSTGSTDQHELASTKDKLAQLQEEVKRLKKNRSAEDTLAKEKQKSQEVQNKYESLMQEYTELGKDYRRVSKSLVTATEQKMELQNLLKTEQEKRHEAETYCKENKEARLKLQKEMEKIQVKWIRDVRELKTKLLVTSEIIKPDPANDMTASAQVTPVPVASVQPQSEIIKPEPACEMTATAQATVASVQAQSLSHVVPVKMEPVREEPVQEVKYEEEVWDM